ncbi:MAG TPA: DUF4097 family beta strand repeat-containing protein [Longimicrobiales bacterium]
MKAVYAGCLLLLAAARLPAQQPADTLGAPYVMPAIAGVSSEVVLDLGRADVRVKRSGDAAVRVWLHALPGRAGPLPAAGELASVAHHAGVMRVTASAAGRTAGVAIVVEVPDGITLEVRLDRGDIAITGVTGTLGLSTSRGDVHINAATGNALVDVKNGNIAASFHALDRAMPSAFATLNGNVDIIVPDDAGFALDARCRGCTARDVPGGDSLRRTRLAGQTQHDAIIAVHGPVQGGGPALRVFTWNGEVSIRQR